MSDFYESLKTEFQDPEYRYGYAESFLNTKLATQIKTLREQRGKTQAEIGALMGIKQPGYRRFEDINHPVWRTDTLWNIARALGVRLDIRFTTFGVLLDDKKRFNKEGLELPEFEKDPAFAPAKEAEKIETTALPPSDSVKDILVSGSGPSLSQPLLESAQPKNHLLEMEKRPVQSVTPQTTQPLVGCGGMR